MRVVGLSGGIATGKSTVSRHLASQGITVIDCDELARTATRKGTWGWHRVLKAFGAHILCPDGEVDRERLGHLVFKDAVARRRLNAATHLPVALALARRLVLCWLSFKLLVVVDMPLLFETKAYKFTHPNVVVVCSDEQQLSRLLQRDGGSVEHARARIAAQLPLADKRRLGNIIVENYGTFSSLQEKIQDLVFQLQRGTLLWGLITSPLVVFALAGAAVLVR